MTTINACESCGEEVLDRLRYCYGCTEALTDPIEYKREFLRRQARYASVTKVEDPTYELVDDPAGTAPLGVEHEPPVIKTSVTYVTRERLAELGIPLHELAPGGAFEGLKLHDLGPLIKKEEDDHDHDDH